MSDSIRHRDQDSESEKEMVAMGWETDQGKTLTTQEKKSRTGHIPVKFLNSRHRESSLKLPVRHKNNLVFEDSGEPIL